MARECANYMKNNDQLYNDYREALRVAHQKLNNFEYVQRSLKDLENCSKMVLPNMLEVAHQNHLEAQE